MLHHTHLTADGDPNVTTSAAIACCSNSWSTLVMPTCAAATAGITAISIAHPMLQRTSLSGVTATVLTTLCAIAIAVSAYNLVQIGTKLSRQQCIPVTCTRILHHVAALLCIHMKQTKHHSLSHRVVGVYTLHLEPCSCQAVLQVC